ncbi:sugar kinase [Virgibacillus dakarensis]|uniref:2-dehydro-3-deoxygluconokinase n=1 Tax=Lentibacillus populi TaxID=1827502 RepID=A0A9W5TV68_9BACI|nr:sugar kinase [Lentibacillus populi]MTW87199.1 sugar kinase [Virgibacillus dakarensis]GGB31941.1 2-dehydro-3-deoxygluconokinase [Lentibacillus populi]
MDVITLGESMVLLSPDSYGPLRYINRFNKMIGGAESNVAVALSRLGHQVGWVSKLGNDEFGLYVRNVIRGEGVDTSQVVFVDDNPTGVFFKERTVGKDPNIYYYRQNSAASTLGPDDVNTSYFRQAKFIHLTGITAALSFSGKAAVKRAINSAKNNNEQCVVFDPNIRLKLWTEEEAIRELVDIAKDCDIVMPGIEEGKLLTGYESPEKIAQFFLERGTSVVVVKLGSKGAYFSTKKDSGYVPGYTVENVVDTVGAGDGFAAGFISGLLRGWNCYDSVRLGNNVGACALNVEGDFEGYPYWEEIDPGNSEKKVTR